MKRRPKRLTLVALFLVAVGVGLPLQIMWMYGDRPWEVASIAAKISPLNWLILMLAPFTAWSVFRASRAMVATVPALAGIVAYNNYFVAEVGQNFSHVATALATGLFLAAVATLLTRETRQLLLNPRSRWWLTPERRCVEIPIRMRVLPRRQTRGRQEFYTMTYDLSEGGAFIPFGRERTTVRELRAGASAESLPTSLKNVPVGTQCYVCLSLKDYSFIQCRAEIVRTSPARGRYPAGVGVRFLGLSWQERKLLAQFIEDMKANKGGKAPATPGQDSEKAAA
jgi:hypothetical protein